jgi:hypothetical protein
MVAVKNAAELETLQLQVLVVVVVRLLPLRRPPVTVGVADKAAD